MRQSELDELQRLVNDERQNLCSKGAPLIQRLIDEAEPEPEPDPPQRFPVFRFDFTAMKVILGRDAPGRFARLEMDELREVAGTMTRLWKCQRLLHQMGVDARAYNDSMRHSHYAAAALMLERVIDGKCVTPTGKDDGHMVYVKSVDGKMVCAFCEAEA